MNYNVKDRNSIENHAKRLEGHSLREFIQDLAFIDENELNKGGLGQLLEKFYFFYDLNNRSEPDFPEANLELKSSPIRFTKNGTATAKERLVLNIIDFIKEYQATWETSSFWKKNAHLLLIFYLHEAGVPAIDRIIKMTGIWDYPEKDLLIIRQDWEKIHQKIKEGKAHELSEGDTMYLGACTKGPGGSSIMREQPFSEKPAPQRAYSLKRNYVDIIVKKWAKDKKLIEQEPIVKDIGELKAAMSFEKLVLDKFQPYIGKTEQELKQQFGIETNPKAKGRYAAISRKILGVSTKRIEEFEKAGVTLKAIRLGRTNKPMEDISFPYFKYKQLAQETDWDTSELREILDRKFLFVFFKQNENEEWVLQTAVFWNMPIHDLDGEAKQVWGKARHQINAGNPENLPRSSETQTIHVRPHGRDNKDLDETPQGEWLPKKSFWLNRKYIKEEVVDPLNLR